jgi:metal-responsive CopG/Arc/MetJ family transcriptional regulator
VSISLPTALLEYADEYQENHGLGSRSEVMLEAIKALREKEWAEAYRAHAEEVGKNSQGLLEGTLADGLEPEEHQWR